MVDHILYPGPHIPGTMLRNISLAEPGHTKHCASGQTPLKRTSMVSSQTRLPLRRPDLVVSRLEKWNRCIQGWWRQIYHSPNSSDSRKYLKSEDRLQQSSQPIHYTNSFLFCFVPLNQVCLSILNTKCKLLHTLNLQECRLRRKMTIQWLAFRLPSLQVAMRSFLVSLLRPPLSGYWVIICRHAKCWRSPQTSGNLSLLYKLQKGLFLLCETACSSSVCADHSQNCHVFLDDHTVVY